MNTPQFSIIIPVLNNVRGFQKALASLTQEVEVEIIVIDGGSTDGTLEFIKENKELFYYWESGLDKGIADAFNRGISKSTGEIVGILNSDDCLEKGALKAVWDLANLNLDGSIYYGCIRFLDLKRSYSFVRKPNVKKMFWRMSVFHPAIFVRRECYEKIGLYKEEYTHAMDAEWCHRAMAMNLSFVEVPSILATMSLGGISDEEYWISLRQYRKSVIEHELASPFMAFVYNYFYLLVKILLRLPLLHSIKRIRNNIFQ